ncbi:MAG: CoA ester lyase [Chloroflexi bacterium]|nr:CoA ester lyase [Chloroflexota bacterium]
MPIEPRPVRSALYVPGNKLDWMRKAPRYGADALVFDLEDSVPPAEKATARKLVRQALDEMGAQHTLIVRVNGVDTGMTADDLEAVTCGGLYGVFLPKTRGPEDVVEADVLLTAFERRVGLALGRTVIVPGLETARAMREAHEVFTASPRVEHSGAVVSRGGDIARALSMVWTRDGRESLFLRSKVLLDARAAGLRYPMGGLWTDIQDLDGLRAFATEMRQIGYTGLRLIHPSHVPVVNEVFTPTAEEIAYWKGLTEALAEAEKRGTTAITYQGDMVDTAMVKTGRQVLALARKLGLTT